MGREPESLFDHCGDKKHYISCILILIEVVSVTYYDF